MQHTGPEEGRREKGRNGDEDCADVQLGMWDPSKNMQTFDTEKHHAGTEAVRSEIRFVSKQPLMQITEAAVNSGCVVKVPRINIAAVPSATGAHLGVFYSKLEPHSLAH